MTPHPDGTVSPPRQTGEPPKHERTALAVASLSCLFLLGVAVNLHFGRNGFMPLDQSIVFDGGWRLLSGQVPFRDFVAPSALTPSVMQVPFFRVAGVTWLALCLHASVVNGFACLAVYALLRLCGSTAIEAAIFGGLTAFFFYPPTGTPFMDQHASFFMLLMFLAVVAGTVAVDPRRERLAWMLVPPLFALGYLSGQVPTAFGALCVAAWVLVNPSRRQSWIVALSLGAVIAATCLFAVAWMARADLRAAWVYLVRMPLQTGTSRTPGAGPLSVARLIVGTFRRLPGWARLWSVDLAVAASVLAVLVLRRRIVRDVRLWVLLSVLFTTAAFTAYSRTPVDAALGLTMLMAGVATSVLCSAIEACLPRASSLPIDRTVPRATSFALVHGLVLGTVVVAATVDTIAFVRRTDIPRMVHAKYDPSSALRARGHLPAALSFMGWTRGSSYYDPDELEALLAHLRDAPGNFLLVGDSTILYGLAQRPSVMPALWLDEGLSIPRFDSREFQQFDLEVERRIRRLDVRRIVIEGPETLTHIGLPNFTRLKQLIARSHCAERWFGGVRVIELCVP